jgi:AbrB family looped-hinge helix DNA binding protein|tara:strand:- start:309 stop:563 length:255 start_codon:yes stop_codon:yes gene_type:complete
MATTIEMGKISSRGQIAIPSDIRAQLGLEEGSKVMFFAENDTLLVKKVTTKTFAEITRPLREAKKKIREEDVPDLIHKLRKNKK